MSKLDPAILPGEQFEQIRTADLTVVVARAQRDWLLPLLCRAPAGFAGERCSHLDGGRGGTLLIERADGAAGGALVVRAGRRGGLPGRLLSTTYFGFSPRVLAELEITAHLRSAGVPVPEPLGAVVQWRAPGLYRSWLATGLVAGADSLLAWLAAERDRPTQQRAARALGASVRRLHAAGVEHPDLNLTNILVGGNVQDPHITLIDFDRARQSPRPIDEVAPVCARLLRSARRFDRGEIDAGFIAALVEGYALAGPLSRIAAGEG